MRRSGFPRISMRKEIVRGFSPSNTVVGTASRINVRSAINIADLTRPEQVLKLLNPYIRGFIFYLFSVISYRYLIV